QTCALPIYCHGSGRTPRRHRQGASGAVRHSAALPPLLRSIKGPLEYDAFKRVIFERALDRRGTPVRGKPDVSADWEHRHIQRRMSRPSLEGNLTTSNDRRPMTLQSQSVLTDAVREDAADPAAGLAALAGSVTIHLPGDAGYDRARTLWNTAVDLRPAAVAEPVTAAEVSAVVAASRQLGLKVAPVSTGHNAGPLVQHDLASTVLVTLEAMRKVEIDPMTAMAKVQGGAQWGDVIDAAAEHGLACLHGSSP